MRQRDVLAIAAALAANACAQPKPVTRSTPMTTVNASYDRTWSALIDFLTASQIPIKTTDKASGLATTETFSLDGWNAQTRSGIANCGAIGMPHYVSVTFVVRADGATSTVRADARFDGKCVTTHVLEQSWEAEVRKKAG